MTFKIITSVLYEFRVDNSNEDLTIIREIQVSRDSDVYPRYSDLSPVGNKDLEHKLAIRLADVIRNDKQILKMYTSPQFLITRTNMSTRVIIDHGKTGPINDMARAIGMVEKERKEAAARVKAAKAEAKKIEKEERALMAALIKKYGIPFSDGTVGVDNTICHGRTK